MPQVAPTSGSSHGRTRSPLVAVPTPIAASRATAAAATTPPARPAGRSARPCTRASCNPTSPDPRQTVATRATQAEQVCGASPARYTGPGGWR